jgi:hypothetical protein
MYCTKKNKRERERNRYVSVNNDNCHSNTNNPSSVLFIYTVGYCTLNAVDVQYINDMQMIRKIEKKKSVYCFIGHTHMYI